MNGIQGSSHLADSEAVDFRGGVREVKSTEGKWAKRRGAARTRLSQMPRGKEAQGCRRNGHKSPEVVSKTVSAEKTLHALRREGGVGREGEGGGGAGGRH